MWDCVEEAQFKHNYSTAKTPFITRQCPGKVQMKG